MVVKTISRNLQEDLDYLMWRIANKYPGGVTIDGSTGTGKTTLAAQCIDYCTRQQMDFSKQLALGSKHSRQILINCHEQMFGAMAFDEAGDFQRRKAMHKDNIAQSQVFDMARVLMIPIFIVLPHIGKLDNSIKDHDFVWMHLHVFTRTEEGAVVGVYDRKNISLLLQYYDDKNITDKMAIYNIVNPNYYCVCKNISKERADDLNAVTLAYKINKIKELDEDEDEKEDRKSIEKETAEPKFDLGKAVMHVMNNIDQFTRPPGNLIDVYALQNHFNVGMPMARRIKNTVIRKMKSDT